MTTEAAMTVMATVGEGQRTGASRSELYESELVKPEWKLRFGNVVVQIAHRELPWEPWQTETWIPQIGRVVKCRYVPCRYLGRDKRSV